MFRFHSFPGELNASDFHYVMEQVETTKKSESFPGLISLHVRVLTSVSLCLHYPHCFHSSPLGTGDTQALVTTTRSTEGARGQVESRAGG